MDNDLTNPKRLQDVASDSKCPVKLSLSVSSSNAVSAPGWIWIWHPAWRTRYWFTRTTDSGILSVVLGQFSKVYHPWLKIVRSFSFLSRENFLLKIMKFFRFSFNNVSYKIFYKFHFKSFFRYCVFIRIRFIEF